MLTIASLQGRYAAGEPPEQVLNDVLSCIDAADRAIWISRVARDDVLRAASRLSAEERSRKPLFGIPYAVKDNIDVARMTTTAGCPAFAYVAERSATVVRLLEAAGAILVGKTNMDQFATGLVGTRTPYGIPRNPFNAAYIPGGSSSGSAVAVARGLVAFALGTDTAGSGRVPAGCTATIGLKPTKGLVSTTGVVPACRSLDCVSVFAASLDDARRVLTALAVFDESDPFSRVPRGEPARTAGLRLGIPRPDQRSFCGDEEARMSFEATLEACGAAYEIRSVDLQPCFDAARLLYDGPFVAERTAALGSFIESHPDDVLDVTRTIIDSGRRYTAAELALAQYAVAGYARAAAAIFAEVDALLVPTSPTIYRIDEVAADPYKRNADLGLYTNFVNLLDLCAVAIPSGRHAAGPPIGVTLIGPAFADDALLETARRLEPIIDFS